ncbi:MAG: cyclic nucleotide-binding domain-containing protein, partial [Planctomycetes bacterium]|nr:cyclic nucleotide-binding domain-containing protein [Planctomycetota bacterium]
ERPTDFPNYPAGSWGPKAAFDLIERDGRRWLEIVNRDVVEKVPLFQRCSPAFLNSLAMTLKPQVFSAGEYVVRKGESGNEMYFLNRGEVEVLDGEGRPMNTLSDGGFFGEIALLLSQPRIASIRAITDCDVFVLDRSDFSKVLNDHPQFAQSIVEVARDRYKIAVPPAEPTIPVSHSNLGG